MSRLAYLMSLTPHETLRLVRTRTPVLKRGPSWTAAELLGSKKFSRGIRFAEFMLRQEAIVRRHVEWESLGFDGKSVVEVGCGPLAGFGPLAIFCGARSFESAEPEWDPNLFFSNRIRDEYLRRFHADLSALHGPRWTFDAFVSALRERMSIVRGGFENAPITGPIDVVLSQSVLEHVFPLEATLAKLAKIQTEKTRFIHLIDFGNHYPTQGPFEGLYEQPAAAYIARRGKSINCLRVPDISRMFAENGIRARVVPSRMAREGYRGAIHPWWRDRYDDGALFTEHALAVSAA